MPTHDSTLRTGRPCANPTCQRLHRNAKYCSKRCTARGVRSAQTCRERLALARRASAAYQAAMIARMIQRVKVLGRTEDERIVLAWRYGKSAAKSQRHRRKVAA